MNLVPINDLSRWDPEELTNINRRLSEVAASGYFMLGPHTKQFQDVLSSRLNGMKVLCVGNGTDALMISLLGLGLKQGDKVATVANAGGYATTAILKIGAVPVLVDVDPQTAQMDPESLSSVLTADQSVKAVVVTHLFGLMADIASITQVTNQHNVLLIEDCAQAIGASVDGKEAGSWGHASTFSFYPTKNLGCLGDGGAVAFRHEADFSRGQAVAQYGWSERYVISEPNGFNTRLDELQATVLLERITRLDSNNEKRRSIVRQYQQVLPSQYQLFWADDRSYVGHLAVLIGPSRTHIQNILQQHKIGHGVHYPLTDNQQPAWSRLFTEAEVPHSEHLAAHIVTLPCFPAMTEEEIAQTCVALSEL